MRALFVTFVAPCTEPEIFFFESFFGFHKNLS